MHQSEKYIPALSYDFLTPLYDPLLRWFMRESAFKSRLITQADIRGGHRVLDLGCGTGTLTIMSKKAQPLADVAGLDADQRVLKIARSKAAKVHVELFLNRGMAYQIPYAGDTFDRVLSSLVFHHISTHDKRRTLTEVLRVLRPGGGLHVVDFGPPQTRIARLIAALTARSEEAALNIRGLLPEMFRVAGFESVEETGRIMTAAGTLSFYKARKPNG